MNWFKHVLQIIARGKRALTDEELLELPLTDEQKHRALILAIDHRHSRITEAQYREAIGTSQEAHAAALQIQFLFAMADEMTEEQAAKAIELNRQSRDAQRTE